MKIKAIIAALTTASAALALSGCESAPGNTEVRDALKNKLIAFGQQMGQKKPTEQDMKEIDTLLKDVKLVGCKKADPMVGYNCDWTGLDGLERITGGSHRFIKTDSGWVLAAAGQ